MPQALKYRILENRLAGRVTLPSRVLDPVLALLLRVGQSGSACLSAKKFDASAVSGRAGCVLRFCWAFVRGALQNLVRTLKGCQWAIFDLKPIKSEPPNFNMLVKNE
jgi:hypothetical protein